MTPNKPNSSQRHTGQPNYSGAAIASEASFACDAGSRLTQVSESWSSMLGWPESESLGRPLRDFLPDDPANAAIMAVLADSTPRSTLPLILPVSILMKNGALLPCKLTLMLLPDGLHAALIRSTAMHRLQDEWMVMQHLPQQLNMCRNTQDICVTVAREARRLFKHDAMAINYVDMQTMLAFTLYEEDTPDGEREPQPFWPPEEHSKPSPLASYDGLEEPSLINRKDASSNDGLTPFGCSGRRSMSLMFTPIRLEGRVVGQLTVQSYTRNKYTESDLALLRSFADQCGAALARTRAVEALFKSEAIFREVIESADGVPYKLDLRSLSYEYIGPKAVALLGIPAEELNHKSLRSIIREANIADPLWKDDERSYVKAFNEGKISQYLAELRIVTPRGEEKWLSDTSVPVRDAISGQVVASLGILQDVTDRKRAEQRLRQSEATKSALLHAIPDMMLIVDRWGVIQDYMPARRFSLHRNPHTALTGRPLGEVFPDIAPYLNPAFCELVLSEQSMRLKEMNLTFAEGSLDVEVRVIPCQADSILVILRDISERKQAEQERLALQSLSQRLTGSLSTHKISVILAEESRKLFQHDAFGILLIDNEHRVVRDLYVEDTPLGETQPRAMPTRPPRALDSHESATSHPRLVNRDGPVTKPHQSPFGDERRLSASLMFAPILWEGQSVGVLTVQSYVPYRYSEHHLELLTAFASQCGAALLRAEAEERLHKTAYYDSMTGLPNRTLLLEVLSDAMDEARHRDDRMLYLLFVDLDRFKNINDSLGYQVGDELLQVVARRLVSVIGELDMAARIGSDEFVIVTYTPNDPVKIEAMCHLIAQEINRPIRIRSHELLVSACVGIAPCSGAYDSADKLLHDAEVAMYMAKRRGRGCHAFFDQFLHEKTLVSIRLESDLASAVRRGELELYYQPIIDLTTARVLGLEALIRWRHAKHGFVMPDEFISIAEDTGLIYTLGEWVMCEACASMANWRKNLPEFRGASISVNVSPRQFTHQGFPHMIERVFAETGLAPEALNVEITETALMEGVDKTADLFRNLKDLGLNLHLDDFGTGYCSLSYLHQIPIDALKIDRSFISDIHINQDKLQITRSIMALADLLNLMVIAEGVELEAHRTTLTQLGCRHAQGMLLCEPLSRADVERYVVTRQTTAS